MGMARPISQIEPAGNTALPPHKAANPSRGGQLEARALRALRIYYGANFTATPPPAYQLVSDSNLMLAAVIEVGAPVGPVKVGVEIPGTRLS